MDTHGAPIRKYITEVRGCSRIQFPKVKTQAWVDHVATVMQNYALLLRRCGDRVLADDPAVFSA